MFSLIIVRVGLGLSSEKTEGRPAGRNGRTTSINLTSFFAPAPGMGSGGTATTGTTATTTDTDDHEYALQTLSLRPKSEGNKEGLDRGVRIGTTTDMDRVDVEMEIGRIQDRVYDGYPPGSELSTGTGYAV